MHENDREVWRDRSDASRQCYALFHVYAVTQQRAVETYVALGQSLRGMFWRTRSHHKATVLKDQAASNQER